MGRCRKVASCLAKSPAKFRASFLVPPRAGLGGELYWHYRPLGRAMTYACEFCEVSVGSSGGLGYLAVVPGDRVVVLHVGTTAEEAEGWVYAEAPG